MADSVDPNSAEVVGKPGRPPAKRNPRVETGPEVGSIPTRKQSGLRKLHLENDRLQLENDKLRFENQRLRTDVSRGRIDLWLRLGMAVGLFGFVCWYLTAALTLAGRPNGETRLTDPALIALFGSTAVNVIGLLLTVARYLFPGPPAKPDA